MLQPAKSLVWVCPKMGHTAEFGFSIRKMMKNIAIVVSRQFQSGRPEISDLRYIAAKDVASRRTDCNKHVFLHILVLERS